MGNRRRDAVFVIFLSVLAAEILFAGTGGRVKGEVVDQNGLAVTGVQITLTSEATNFRDTTTTDEKGKFAYYFIDATEPYNIRFEKAGHLTTDVPVNPQVGGNLRIHVVVPTEDSESQGGEVAAQPVLSRGAEAFNSGVNAARSGDMTTAEAKFLEAIKIEPKLVAPYAALASLYQDEGENEKAVDYAQKALALEPDNPRALMSLYDVYNSQGENDRAETYLQKVIDAGGGMEAAIRIFNAGAVIFREGDLEQAAQRFNEAIRIAPEFAAAYAALGTIHIAQGQTQSALEAANAALAIEPQNKGALRTKFNALQALGDEAAAAETLAVMAQSDSAGTAEAFYSRGKQAFEAGQIELATEALGKAVEVDPTHAAAHYTLGLCFINSGNSAQAKTHLKTFLELEPEHPEAPNAREMLKYAG